jgi:hypothetical protein
MQRRLSAWCAMMCVFCCSSGKEGIWLRAMALGVGLHLLMDGLQAVCGTCRRGSRGTCWRQSLQHLQPSATNFQMTCEHAVSHVSNASCSLHQSLHKAATYIGQQC